MSGVVERWQSMLRQYSATGRQLLHNCLVARFPAGRAMPGFALDFEAATREDTRRSHGSAIRHFAGERAGFPGPTRITQGQQAPMASRATREPAARISVTSRCCCHASDRAFALADSADFGSWHKVDRLVRDECIFTSIDCNRIHVKAHSCGTLI